MLVIETRKSFWGDWLKQVIIIFDDNNVLFCSVKWGQHFNDYLFIQSKGNLEKIVDRFEINLQTLK